MKKQLPAASELVAKALQKRGEDISVDEIEAIYEQTMNDPFKREMVEWLKAEMDKDPKMQELKRQYPRLVETKR
jgi:hypothetical protein